VKFDRTKFTKKFVAEAREHLGYLARAIVALENAPDDKSNLPEIKRAAHTLKGSARMLKYTSVSAAAHHTEDVLLSVIEKGLVIDANVADLLLGLVDYMRRAIEEVAEGRDEPEAPQELLSLAERVAAGEQVEFSKVSSEALPTPDAPVVETAVPTSESDVSEKPQVRSVGAETLRVSVPSLDSVLDAIAEIRLEQAVLDGAARQAATKCRRLLAAVGGDECEQRRDMIRNQIEALLRDLEAIEERQYRALTDVRVLFELAESLRMVPLSDLFERFVLPVRETARTRGKRVKLETSGAELGLDKQIVDQLVGPMLHLITNAVDHGVEKPGLRESTGKSPTGCIRIKAMALAGTVEISVSDDGSGVDVDRLVQRAIERGVVTAADAAKLTRPERMQLVFHPGLSCAEIVTETSGRGVGMDVVKKVVEQDLKGSVWLESEPGIGTTTRLRLPLSLSSSRLFLVEVLGQTLAISLSAVVSSQTPEKGDFIDVAGRRAIKVENQFIPVASAAQLLGLPGSTHAGEGVPRRLIIVASGSERLAIGVDEILDEREMLVKPLPGLLEGLVDVAGITFSDQGEPIPVLHIPDLVGHARAGVRTVAAPGGAASAQSNVERRILVVDDSYNTREVQRHILETHGYSVVTAADGLEALERLEVETVDLVVTDVEMPRLDGFRLVERIRADERFRRLPIIILTSRESEGDRARGVEVGANAYIVKRTFDEQKLTVTLETLLP